MRNSTSRHWRSLGRTVCTEMTPKWARPSSSSLCSPKSSLPSSKTWYEVTSGCTSLLFSLLFSFPLCCLFFPFSLVLSVRASISTSNLYHFPRSSCSFQRHLTEVQQTRQKKIEFGVGLGCMIIREAVLFQSSMLIIRLHCTVH